MSNYGTQEIIKNSKFFKADSKSQTIRLIGDSFERRIHGHGKEATPCVGEGCAQCANASPTNQRFKANVFNWNSSKVQIWDYSPAVAGQLQAISLNLKTDGADIVDVDLKISAAGEGMQRKHTIMPWPSSKALPPGLALYDLEEAPF